MKKDMDKVRQIMVFAIIGLFLGTSFLPSMNGAEVKSNYLPDDDVDQSNSGWGSWAAPLTAYDARRAQEFTPTKNILTRVFLYFHLYYRSELDPEDLDTTINLEIKEELTGDSLVTCTVNTKDFVRAETPDQNYRIEFDFPDVQVTPGEPLFILCDSWGTEELHMSWYVTSSNVYPGGSAWWFVNEQWDEKESWDFHFETYGKDNNPPEQPSVVYDSVTDYLIIVGSDADGDRVRYGVSWENNGVVDQWTGFVDSGSEARVNCAGREGVVGVIAEDEHGLQSEWFSVQSKAKNMPGPFFSWVVDHLQIVEFLQLFLQGFHSSNYFNCIENLLVY